MKNVMIINSINGIVEHYIHPFFKFSIRFLLKYKELSNGSYSK